jgi:hypothetical protein
VFIAIYLDIEGKMDYYKTSVLKKRMDLGNTMKRERGKEMWGVG